MDNNRNTEGIRVVDPNTGEVLVFADDNDPTYVPVSEEQELWGDIFNEEEE